MHDMHEMQLRYNPNIHNPMKMRCLEMRAHGHANRGNERMRSKIQPSMHYAVKKRCLEMRAYGHANRENDIRNANEMEMAYRMQNGLILI